MSTCNRLRLLAIAGAIAVFGVPSVAAADSVRLYEHANLRGESFVPSDDQPDFRKVKFGCILWSCKNWNDRVSSLHVPAYQCVWLFENVNKTGASRQFCGETVHPGAEARDYPYVGDFWNDRASSSITLGRKSEAPAATRKFDVVVRTYNQWGPGARMGDRVVDAVNRFAVDARDALGDPGDMGIIATQEGRTIASGVGGECPYALAENTSEECLRAALRRAFAGSRPATEAQDGLGITWDKLTWENIGFPVSVLGSHGRRRIVNVSHARWELPPRRVRHCIRLVGTYQCGPSSWPKSYMIGVRLKNVRTGTVLRVFDVHMAADQPCHRAPQTCDTRHLTPALADNSDRRLAQSTVIRRILQNQPTPSVEAPFVLTGDFNFDPTGASEPETQANLLANAAVLRSDDGTPAISGIDNMLVGRSERYPLKREWRVGATLLTLLKPLPNHDHDSPPTEISDHDSPAVGLYLTAGSQSR